MTRIMLATLLVLAAAPASAAERRYAVTDFDRIEISGPFVVSVSTGRGSSARATGSSAAIERVSIEVQGRTLRIKPNRSSWGGYPGEATGSVRIDLTTHNLRSASVSGSGALTIDKAKAMRFDAAVAGTGRLALAAVEADTLSVGMLGSGTVELAGAAKSLRATVQGSGDFKAEKLMTDNAQINSDTAGSVAVSVRTTAKVTSSGTGDTRILGKPACTVKQTGSGEVRCGR
jgi:hypothetical protein